MKIVMIAFLVFAAIDTTFASDNQLVQFEKECLSENSLSCAKAGYLHRRNKNNVEATKYYQLGCELKEESSCFNVRNFSTVDLFTSRFHNNLKFHEETIRKCHIPSYTAIYSNSQLEEKWYLVNINFVLNKQGEGKTVKVETNLPNSFIKCAEEALKKIKYPQPPNDNFKINYKMTISYQEKI